MGNSAMPTFRFPLKQHIGSPATAVVAEGATVQRGRLIAAKPEGALGANLHASISGTVSRVAAEFIEIEADSGRAAETAYEPLSGETPRELIEASGLVGLGGAGYPAWAKLAPLDGGTVIMNAAECEPILAHNIGRLERGPEKAMKGLRIVMALTGADRGFVALKPGHDRALAALKPFLSDGIRLCLLPTHYPAGEERAVVRQALGVLPGVDELPAAAGAVVFNAETLHRLCEAVEEKKPMIDKDVTVAGKLAGPRTRVFYDVPVGLPVGALLEMAGGASGYGEILLGGPFTGRRAGADDPILKTTGGVLAAEEFPRRGRRLGLLVCACGAGEARLREIAASMDCSVALVETCSQAKKVRQALKCENPGHCPGQAAKVLALKRAGAEEILIANCADCTNTVMACAPRLGLVVHHATDGALRAVNHPLIRKLIP